MNTTSNGHPRVSLRLPNLDGVVATGLQHWRMILLATAGGLMAAFVSLFFITSTYEISASLLFKLGRENSAPPVAKGESLLLPSRPEQIVSEIEMLTSRHLLDEVVRSFGEDFFLKSPEPVTIMQHVKAALRTVVRYAKDALREVSIFLGLSPRLTPRDMIVSDLEQSLEVEQLRRSDTVRVSLNYPDPVAGVAVVKRVLDLFMEEHIRAYKTPGAQLFFEQQANALSEELRSAEQRRTEIRRALGVWSPVEQRRILLDQERDIGLQRAGTDAEVARLSGEIPHGRKLISSRPREELTSRVQRRNPTQDTLRQRLTELRSREESRRAAFRDDSRVILDTDAEIVRLQSLIGQESQFVPESETYESDTVRQFERELLQKSETLEGLRTKEQKQARQLGVIEERLRVVSEAEDQLKAREREIGVLEQNYLLYKRKLEESRILEAMDTSQISNVSVIVPAVASPVPVKPKKLLVLLLGLMVGLFGSLAVVFGREAMRPVVRSINRLEQVLSAPVLARLPQVP
jgi:succinoglycan biosynthesis transport protein ExoP